MKMANLSVQVISRPLGAKRILFTAIRTAYSADTAFENWVGDAFADYEAKPARDLEGGTEADRLIRNIVKRGHTSTLEHLNFTFAISGVSRALLAQLSRHRVGVSPTVQSQRYVDDKSDGGKGGFEVIIPDTVHENAEALALFTKTMDDLQAAYDALRALGIPKEDARGVLPNAASTTLTLTMNLRALLHFYHIRHEKGGAQGEIKELAEQIVEMLIFYEPWLEYVFKAGVGTDE